MLKSVYSSSREQTMSRYMLSIIITSFLLSACGTKGMLYLPEREYPLPAQTPAEKAPADASKK